MSLGELYVRGVSVNWQGFDQGYSRRRLRVPTYPFQRERYWLPESKNQKEKRPLVEKQVSGEMMASAVLEKGTGEEVSENQVHANNIEVTAFQNALLSAAPTRRQDQIKQHLSQLVAKILGIPLPKLDPKISLVVQGLESLRSFELRNRIQMEVGVTLSPVWLLTGVSLNELIDQVFALFQVTEIEAHPAEDQSASEERLTL
jgi:acyl transferase domain-containing protein